MESCIVFSIDLLFATDNATNKLKLLNSVLATNRTDALFTAGYAWL